MKQPNSPEEAYLLLRQVEEKILTPSIPDREFSELQKMKLFYLTELEKWGYKTDQQLDLLRLRISTTREKNPTLELTASQKIEKSLNIIGEEEFNFFLYFFNLGGKGPQAVVSFIEELQEFFGYVRNSRDLAKNIDGTIGPGTLEQIYIQYYSKSQQLPFFIKHRLEIYYEMNRYGENPRNHHIKGRLHPSTVPNIFSKSYYFGEVGGQNKPNTFVNLELAKHIDQGLIPHTLSIQNNLIVVNKIFNKFYLLVYVKGRLSIATYCSPGDPNQDGGIITKKGRYATSKQKSSMYYISSADASVTQIGDKQYGAIMPYAFNIYGGVFGHAGMVNGERRSHGCIRTPMFYAKAIYETIKTHGNFQVDIEDS